MKMKAVWHEGAYDGDDGEYVYLGERAVTIVQITQLQDRETLAIAVTSEGRLIEEHIGDFVVEEIG